jgi:hypothetical protein
MKLHSAQLNLAVVYVPQQYFIIKPVHQIQRVVAFINGCCLTTYFARTSFCGSHFVKVTGSGKICDHRIIHLKNSNTPISDINL